ncbi:MAG TPA: SDR family oxidoreductase, partial [Nitrospiria bacterium]|nr:SDR family oxidoreductase [Nitrospiria bacterium]
ILVNMVSVYEEIRIGKISRKSWESYMESELRTASRLALGASKRMKRRKDGRIILFSDWVAASGRPRYRNFLPYYVAKAAIVGLVESLALELAPGILVNAVAPGPILPPKKISPEEKRSVSRATPLARWGGAAEVAKAVLFLVETDFVTGECIRVDGGRHLL